MNQLTLLVTSMIEFSFEYKRYLESRILGHLLNCNVVSYLLSRLTLVRKDNDLEFMFYSRSLKTDCME